MDFNLERVSCMRYRNDNWFEELIDCGANRLNPGAMKFLVRSTLRRIPLAQLCVIFVSPQYTQSQVDAMSFKEVVFDLYDLRKYGDTYSWNHVTVKIRESTSSCDNQRWDL